MANEELQREPCLHCGEPASTIARICPHCSNSLLVDVQLEHGLADPRQAYQLARTLSRMVPSMSFIEVKKVLGTRAPTVARAVTRDTAARVLRSCADFQIEGRAEIAATSASKSSRPALPMNMNWIAVAGAAGLVLLAVVAFWALSFSTGGEPADENPDSASVPSPDRAPTAVVDTNAPLTTEEIVAAASPATVSVTCPNTIGSGFFVTAEMLLTNAHVVCEGTDTVVVHFADGSTLEGWVRQRNEEWDLASVEVRGANVEPLPPGDASRLRAGQKIVVIGTPLGMAYSVHEGIISNTGRHMFGVNYLQIDANINPGNSGGPLLNEHGQVVGVVSMKTGEGIGFALPINYAYAGATPFFHASIPISDSWRETVTRMAEEEEREAQKARSAFIRPGLVHIEPVPPTIAVVVIMRSIVRPSAMDLRAYVDVDGIEHCRGDVRIRGWGSLEAVGASVTDGSFDAQLRWLEKHGIADDIWFGAGELDRQSCPGVLRASGGELVLEQGEEGYDRMRIGIR